MGLVRLFLALGVVRDHRTFFEAFFLVKGGVAVVFFYIISGFYMSLVIKEKYSKLGAGWEKKFLLSRALRLFPAYWAVLAFSILVMPLMGSPTVFTSALGLTAFERALAIFSNTFIVGLDILISGGVLHWHPGPGGLIPTWPIYPVMTAWTVAVEITFYVLAAFFIMRNRRIAFFALGLGIYLRLWFLLVNGRDLGFSRDGLGFSNLPWGYHFFGIDLIFFMFGYVAYEIYVRLNERLKQDPKFMKTIHWMVGVLGCIVLFECYLFNGFQTIHDYNDHILWATIPFFVLLIPPLFIATKRSVFDDFLGSFSYPIYLCHVIAPDVASAFLGFPKDNAWTTLISVSAASSALVFGVEKPMDAIRHRLTLGHTGKFDFSEMVWAQRLAGFVRRSALKAFVSLRAYGADILHGLRYDRSMPAVYLAGGALLCFAWFGFLMFSAPAGHDSYLIYLRAVKSLDQLTVAQAYAQLVANFRLTHPGWFPVATLPLVLWAAGASLGFVKFIHVFLIAVSFALFALIARRLTGTLTGTILALVSALCVWQLRFFDDPIGGTSLLIPWSADLVMASYLAWLNSQSGASANRWRAVTYITMVLALLSGTVAWGLEIALLVMAFATAPRRKETWGLVLAAIVTIGASWAAAAPRIPWRDAHTYVSNVLVQMFAALPASFRGSGHLPLGHVPALYYQGTRYIDDRFINVSEISTLAWVVIVACAALCYVLLSRPLRQRAATWVGRAVITGLALWIAPALMLGTRGAATSALTLGQAFDGVYFEYFGVALLLTVGILRLRALGGQLGRLAPALVALSVVLTAYGDARADGVVISHWQRKDEARQAIRAAAADGFFTVLADGSTIAIDPSLPFANGIHSSVADAKYMLYTYTGRRYNVVSTAALGKSLHGNVWILRTNPHSDIPVYLARWAGGSGRKLLTDKGFGYTVSATAQKRAASEHVGVTMNVTPLTNGAVLAADRTCGAVAARDLFVDSRPTVTWESFYPQGPYGYQVASASNAWGDVLPYFPKMYMEQRATLILKPGSCHGTYSNIQFDVVSAAPAKLLIAASDGTKMARVKISQTPQTVWLRYDTRRGRPIRISLTTDAAEADKVLDPINFRYEHDKPRHVRAMIEADHVWSDRGKQRVATWP